LARASINQSEVCSAGLYIRLTLLLKMDSKLFRPLLVEVYPLSTKL